MKASVIIQARMGARRLPGKVLLKVCGKTIVEHVVERIHQCKNVDEAVVATTVAEQDLPLVNLLSSKGIRVFCGSEDDVLDRYYQAARLFGFKHVVRITADCPLIDPKIVDQVITAHFKSQADYTGQYDMSQLFPDGQDVEVFSFAALKSVGKSKSGFSTRACDRSFARKQNV